MLTLKNTRLPFSSNGYFQKTSNLIGWIGRLSAGYTHPKRKLARTISPLHDNAVPLTFDKASTTYLPELDIALQAWRAVSATEGKGKPKAQIKAWLETNAKELTGEAKERIATVANWHKIRGATRTDLNNSPTH